MVALLEIKALQYTVGEQAARITELEAENERLREQNKHLHQHVSFYHKWATP